MCFFKETIKFGVLAYIVIFVLIGTALATIGAIYKLTFDDLSIAIPESYVSLQLIPLLTIIVGSLVFLVTFFGCTSIFVNNSNLILTYGGILSSIVIFQIAVGTFTFLEIQDRDDLSGEVNSTLDDIFQKGENPNFVNLIQLELHCCGTYGANFWNQTIQKPFPKTCCKTEECTDVHREGCQTAIFELFIEAAKVIGISMYVFAVAEITGTVLVFLYAREVIQRKGYARNLFEE